MSNEENKKNINATEGVKGLLKMNSEESEDGSPIVQRAGAPPENLPFMNIEEPPINPQTHPEIPKQAPHPLGGPASPGETGPIEQILAPAERRGHELYATILWVIKNV